MIHFYSTNIVFTGAGFYADVVVRNNVIADAYDSSGAHSQGMFAGNLVGAQLTDNIFDHNGWLELPAGHPLQKKAGATMFNHNTYIAESVQLALVGNMFLRASSMGNKFRSDHPHGEKNIEVRDNLYVEGEIGVGIGGNIPEFKNGTAHFDNVSVVDNVFVEIGRAQPTNRTLAWPIDVNDWRGGQVSRNLVLNVTKPSVTNAFGVHVHGAFHDAEFADNVIYNLHTKDAYLLWETTMSFRYLNFPLVLDLYDICISRSRYLCVDTDIASNITFVNNAFQAPFYASVLGQDGIKSGLSQWSGYSFAKTSYYSIAPPAKWFMSSAAEKGEPLTAWDAMTHGTGSVPTATKFLDPSRSLEEYAAAHGSPGTFEGFWAAARLHGAPSASCGASDFTASAVNTWLRAGFVVGR